jgi:hypothetical protein
MTGCSSGPYQLQGVVVSGKMQSIEIVSKDDPRLQSMPIPDAGVSVIIDPGEMNPGIMTPAITDEKGQFAIEIDRMGIGSWQEYNLNIVGQAGAFAPTNRTIKAPSGNKRVLITLVPGRDNYQTPHDIIKETLQMKEQLMR